MYAKLQKENDVILAKFYGDKNGRIDLKDKAQVDSIIKKIDNKQYKVIDIKKSERRKNPPAPFTTSSLQQEASRKLGFGVKKTMMVAQKLYEAGYITYMRTDSTRLSDDAKKMAKEYITDKFGKNYYLNREFKGYKNIHTYGYNLIIEEECVKLYKELKDENIDILINNAGFGDAGNFTETSLDKEMDMIDLNIKAYHILTKLFLKDFVKRDYGRILNVASMAGFMPGPYMATYYATKNYIVSLSLAIYEELKRDKSNVKISIFCPGPVNTNFNNVADVKFNISSLNSEYASKVAIDGLFMNKLLIIPNNMKFNHLLTKIVPTKSILFVNSLIQERKEE